MHIGIMVISAKRRIILFYLGGHHALFSFKLEQFSFTTLDFIASWLIRIPDQHLSYGILHTPLLINLQMVRQLTSLDVSTTALSHGLKSRHHLSSSFHHYGNSAYCDYLGKPCLLSDHQRCISFSRPIDVILPLLYISQTLYTYWLFSLTLSFCLDANGNDTTGDIKVSILLGSVYCLYGGMKRPDIKRIVRIGLEKSHERVDERWLDG